MQRCANKVRHTVLCDLCEAMALPVCSGQGEGCLDGCKRMSMRKTQTISDHLRPHPGVIFVGPTCAGEHRYNHGILEPVEIPDWMPCWPV